MLTRLATGPHDYTAIISYNNSAAMGIIRVLHRAGKRIPEDISVVDWDHTPAPFASPSMASIDPKFVQMGREAGKLAVEIAKASGSELTNLNMQRIVVLG